MSLQQRIQREIDEEARIDKRIEALKKHFLRQHANKKYRIVSTRKEADAILFFNRTNLTKYNIMLNEDINEETKEVLESCEHNPYITLVFLKNKNPHDAKLATCGDIRSARK